MAATATLLTRDIQGETLSGVTDRLVNTVLIHEGVIMRNNANSFEVKQNLGTDMNVKIGSTVAFDLAVIQGDNAGQGVFIAEHQNATQVLAIAASDPTNDRIDIVILRIYDDTFDSSGNDYSDLEVITGTPDASPVAPAVPAGSFVLAEILVQDTVTQIVDGDITDQRVEAPIRGELVQIVYFTASGTFTKADYPWLHKVQVRLVGGGGGGGGCALTSATQACAGGGGGGGAYAEVFLLEAALGAAETVTVGAGGSGGAAGDNVGVAGADSKFGGALCIGEGGQPGSGDAAVTPPRYGATGGAGGGIAGVGDLQVAGGRGLPVAIFEEVVTPSPGGASMFAPMRTSSLTTSGTDGSDGDLYGAGGSGGANADDQGSGRAGGDGADGIVIVYLYA